MKSSMRVLAIVVVVVGVGIAAQGAEFQRRNSRAMCQHGWSSASMWHTACVTHREAQRLAAEHNRRVHDGARRARAVSNPPVGWRCN